jgi:hypothetical protein
MSGPSGFDKALASVQNALDAIRDLPNHVAEWYCTTIHMNPPLVDRHFTPGNGPRYNWPNLAPSTLASKQGNLTEVNKNRVAAGLKKVKLDATQGIRTTPMMVLTSELRQLTASTGVITPVGPGQCKIVWPKMPDWAIFHIEGGKKPGHPPQRNFIQPNAEDMEFLQVKADLFISQAIGGGRTNPIAKA